MDALTTPYTLSASLALESGVIEETDTLEIIFTQTGGKVLKGCDLHITLPTDFGFADDATAESQGKWCFAKSSSTINSYNDLDLTYTFTYPVNSDYAGGTIIAEGLCPIEGYDLTCAIKVTGVINPQFVGDTSTLTLALYGPNGGEIAKQDSGLIIEAD